MTTATLKYTPKVMQGEFKDSGLELSIHLPNGKVHKLAFVPKNDYTLDLPLKLTYVDDFKQTKTMYENFPQAMLNAYPNELTLFELKEAPLVEAPIVTQPKIKKEKQNEKK